MIPPIFWNYCRWNSTTAGTGAFTVGTAAANDDAGAHAVPENCSVISGNTYKYYASVADGSQWEWGRGVYNSATHTLARTVVVSNSNDTTTPVNFATNPVIDQFPPPQKSVESPTFDVGTTMLFQQTNAPTGWVKQTTHDNKALRVVSGAASFGGTNSFTTVMAQTAVGNTTLTISQMPVHNHLVNNQGGNNFDAPLGDASTLAQPGTSVTGDNGGGGAHNHAITMDIQYVDLIIAKKS
jgi:hypothetical protein